MPKLRPNGQPQKMNKLKVVKAGGTNGGSVLAKKKLFVEEFFRNGRNGTKAALALGMGNGNYNSAATQATRLMRDPVVVELIEKRTAEIVAKSQLTTDEVLKSLADALRFDPRKLFDENGHIKKITELDDETALQLEGVDIEDIIRKGGEKARKTKLDFPKKTSVREQAMRFFGLFAKDKRGFDPEDDGGGEAVPTKVVIHYKDARRRKE